MSRSKSSKNWLEEHFADEYVKKAQAAGYRSRAVFKLMEIQDKDKLIKPGMSVVDLGAAPGGWSVLAKQWVGHSGVVFALDILEIEDIAGVTFIQGDFREEEVLNTLLAAMNGALVDLVMSDLAPNISGNKSVDQPRAIYLIELALDFAQQVLRPGGSLIVKIFQGAGFDEYLAIIRRLFKQVTIRKPKASRSRSKEAYIVARGYNL